MKKIDITKEQIENYIAEGLSNIQIAEKLNVEVNIISNRIKEFNIDVKSIKENNKPFNNKIFDVINTEEKAYWLGFLYADGTVSSKGNRVRVHLKAEDVGHLIKLKTFFCDSRPDSIISIKEDSKTSLKSCYYSVVSFHLKETLIKLGCIPNKSLVLKFPDKNIFHNENLIYDFIRGYIDGDGCLSHTRNKKGLHLSAVGTLDFLTGIMKIFPEFSLYKKRSSNIYEIYCYYSKADNVAMKLYANATVYLDRKFKRFATLCKLYNASEKSGNIGEGCDANTEITSEITKGPEES